MPGVVDLPLLIGAHAATGGLARATELGEDVQAPVPYDGPWVRLIVIGLVAVALYYLAVWLLTRAPRSFGGGGIPRRDVPDARRDHLVRLDQIEREVRSGALPPRVAHQRISEAVRSYVGVVSSMPASSMALADLRAHAPGELADAIGVMYTPEFAPDDGSAGDRLDEALHRARQLVTRWS